MYICRNNKWKTTGFYTPHNIVWGVYRSHCVGRSVGLSVCRSVGRSVASFPRSFSVTTGWISMKLYGRLHYQWEMCILSAWHGPMILPYIARTWIFLTFVSARLLSNYWWEFNETLWEASIPMGDVHIISLTRSNDFALCCGYLNIF